MSFEKNIFINCPFDEAYKKFLRPLVFTALYCGMEPQLAQTTDSGSIRFHNILDLIRNSKFSIHDLSRMKAKKVGEIARFNMPFELGLDLGCKHVGKGKLSAKKSLIIDTENHRYRSAISDLSGNDIEAYNEDPETLVRAVRNWLRTVSEETLPSGSVIWENFNEFYYDFIKSLKAEGFQKKDFQEMKISEYTDYARVWIKARVFSKWGKNILT